MHEYSVVQAFIELCEDYVCQNECSQVISAKVKIGILSGIELGLFQRALETFKVGSVLQNAQIEYVLQPLEISCKTCKQVCSTQKPQKICPLCQSEDTEVLDGEEMVLLHLEME